MAEPPHFEAFRWMTYAGHDHMELILRTNGRVFNCTIDPALFENSPALTERYLYCRRLLRREVPESEDYTRDDALGWLTAPMRGLIAQLAPTALALGGKRPRLSQYLYPDTIFCEVSAVDEEIQVRRVRGSVVRHVIDVGFSSADAALREWAQTYDAEEVGLCYDHPDHILIRPPTKVVIGEEEGQEVFCTFKEFKGGLDERVALREVDTLARIAGADIPGPPEVFIAKIRGFVLHGRNLLGVLFDDIGDYVSLAEAVRFGASEAQRTKWKGQVERSVGELHKHGIAWGNAGVDNVLVDMYDNAWVTDFTGSAYEEEPGVQGDRQGLERIRALLETGDELPP